MAIPDLLKAQQEHHDLLPAKLIYDQAAGTGKHHADVAKASGGQTQFGGAARSVPGAQRARFGPDDFALSPDEAALTCPPGRVSSTVYRSRSQGQGRIFRFSSEQCRACPLAPQCRSDEVPPDHMRQVFVSDHRSTLAQARTYAQTEAFQEDLKARATMNAHRRQSRALSRRPLRPATRAEPVRLSGQDERHGFQHPPVDAYAGTTHAGCGGRSDLTRAESAH